MKKLFILLLIGTLFASCSEVGDYQYIIYMKDGTQVKALNVESDGGGLRVIPMKGDYESCDCFGFYFLSSEQYTRVDYVGLKNDFIKEKRIK